MSEFDVQMFINDVFERRQLWDGSTGKKDVKEVLWDELSVKFELSIAILKRKWQNLRSSFRKQLKKVPRNAQNEFVSSPHLLQSKFPYYRSMLFLADRICHVGVTSSSNVDNQGTSNGIASTKREKSTPSNNGVQMKRKREDSDEENMTPSNGIASTKGEKSTPSNNGVQMKRQRHDSNKENLMPSNGIASTKGEKSTPSNNGVQKKRQRDDSGKENVTAKKKRSED